MSVGFVFTRPRSPTSTTVSKKATDRDPIPPGYRLIFRRYIVKNGKKIYPKNGKVFPILVKE